MRQNRLDSVAGRVRLGHVLARHDRHLPDSDLGHCFEQAAKHDWPGSLSAERAINSKELLSRAYIAASRGIL